MNPFKPPQSYDSSMVSQEDSPERRNFPNVNASSTDASTTVSKINIPPVAKMIVQDPLPRQQAIDTYNKIRNAEQEYNDKKQARAERKRKIEEQFKKLKEEADALDKQEKESEREEEKRQVKKRDLLAMISQDDMMEFMYDAGRSAKQPRH